MINRRTGKIKQNNKKKTDSENTNEQDDAFI